MPDKSEPSPVDMLLIKNKRNNNGAPNGVPISVVTLKRTDTTLDLSQKAKRSCQKSQIKKRVVVEKKKGEGRRLCLLYFYPPPVRDRSALFPRRHGPRSRPEAEPVSVVGCGVMLCCWPTARACVPGTVLLILTGSNSCGGCCWRRTVHGESERCHQQPQKQQEQ